MVGYLASRLVPIGMPCTTTVFMGGAHPRTPVDAFTDVETKSTTVSDVINRALLNTDQVDATIRSVRFAPTIAAAADLCGIASDAFTKVLSRFVDTSSTSSNLKFTAALDQCCLCT